MLDLSTSLYSGRKGGTPCKSSINSFLAPITKKSRSAYTVDSILSAAISNMSSSFANASDMNYEGTIEVGSFSGKKGGDAMQHILKRPGVTTMAPYWKHSIVYDSNMHQDKINIMHCNLCGTDISFKGSTSELNKHLKFIHSGEWQKVKKSGTLYSWSSLHKSIKDYLVKDDKKTLAELEMELIHADTNWVIVKCLPVTICWVPVLPSNVLAFHKFLPTKWGKKFSNCSI